ncbi:AAA family ATPase [Sinorhizobium meliloti]|uniref:UvrD-helicase domain-containing protein n=1 Tax=Rhizobium meliloti TaxID=382 RepID=UPI00131298F1|nr:AAA family ATPase [Sinorhizobium meliloti]MDX0189872.1 AAA family ATPase [Sinorhizobium meliloti]MQV11139.1 AAA family ATPase [Sinorhizobium meliloti]MQV61542.1 AAA family ATPase [Sinorhizobium meliloti]
MRSPNRIVIAAAGGGKTTRIVDEVLADKSVRSAIITYTRNNVREIQATFYQRGQAIPPHVEIIPWYTFLLREMARPYRNHKYGKRIDGIFWTETTVDRFAPKSDAGRYYFGNSSNIYSNKLAEFVCDCNAISDNAIVRRLEQRFERVYIDEIQDFAGYDLDILELLLRSNLEVVLVGDPRQSTFTTNNANRHKGFRGPDIIKKFREWEKKKLVELQRQVETHRCNQMIADLADSFYPDHEKTRSRNKDMTGHDGVFSIKTGHVTEYINKFKPQVLRLSVKTECAGFPALNFGESKGMTFDRILIFPHKKAQKWLKTGDYELVSGVKPELYVGVTRARYSVTFVYDGTSALKEIVPH